MNTALLSHVTGRRAVLRGVVGAAAAAVAWQGFPSISWSQQQPGGAERWRLLINEAVTADLSISMLALRYRGWADYLGGQIRSKQVVVDPVIDIQNFVRQASSDQKPLMVFGKSVNQLSKLVRDGGYQPLVRRPEPYKAAFIVKKDSPINEIGQLSGKKILMPDESSATVAVARAEMRRLNVREPYISYTRYQDSVTAQVAAGLAEVGAVNPTLAKKWQEGGGRVIGETQPVVNWSVLAAPGVPPELVSKLTESLLAMNSQSSGILSEIGVKQWVKADRKEYLALLDYTHE
ncbi:ABC-type phosphate/phosphonate transport system, periplasmic component [Polaromonas sp. CF318]|uniref:phosphate/phosphite/phosphonate ABC transporter substrate-binding protein n=1 Tax=Polaromonas sp. CF318 TaxID=1144318 RepID=UPI000271015B|nr:PhnD/SsuA/transferrin family substrate-binding protein [Polaromonas sp. CF318]EJL82280.1 ABC-type phosphate/phosphonate transport system, periplasmic component [Polaromonas sp. CF318]